MRKLSYNNNPVQKIVSNIFCDLRVFDKEKFFAGAQVEVFYKGKSLGTAEVVAGTNFKLKNLPDTLCYMATGKPSGICKKTLLGYYPMAQNETVFSFVALQWLHRDIEYQEALLQEYWTNQREAHFAPKQATFNFQ